MSNGHYILIGQTAVPCEDLLEWGMWFETSDRRVFLTRVGEWEISTVFLGLDHSFDDGEPLLFETMIFWREKGEGPGGCFELLEWQERYSEWSEAERGHERAVGTVEARTGLTRREAEAQSPR